MSLLDFIKNIDAQEKDIIYFGGHFNPWHEGHSECLRKSPRSSIKVVIPDHNPLKQLSNRVLDIDREEIKSLNDNIYIYTGFFEQQIKNPTVNWLCSISRDLPDYSHSLLMGYDSYESLHKWSHYTDLLQCLDGLYVLNRQNSAVDKLYDIETVFLGRHPYESLSSTNIREKKSHP